MDKTLLPDVLSQENISALAPSGEEVSGQDRGGVSPPWTSPLSNLSFISSVAHSWGGLLNSQVTFHHSPQLTCSKAPCEYSKFSLRFFPFKVRSVASDFLLGLVKPKLTDFVAAPSLALSKVNLDVAWSNLV